MPPQGIKLAPIYFLDYVEGIYEFALPQGAIITDLVLWINGEPIKE